MKYFTGEGQYVWQMDSNHPRRDPVCVFDDVPEDWASVIADALNHTYIEAFEAGVWAPEEKE